MMTKTTPPRLQQSKRKLPLSKLRQWRHRSFTIDWLLLQAVLLRASKGDITLPVFFFICFHKLKRRFKWALHSSTRCGDSTSWDKWNAGLSAGSKPHTLVPCTRLLISFSLNYYFWGSAFSHSWTGLFFFFLPLMTQRGCGNKTVNEVLLLWAVDGWMNEYNGGEHKALRKVTLLNYNDSNFLPWDVRKFPRF